MSEEPWRGLKLGDSAIRIHKKVMFVGSIVGGFINSKKEQFFVMETYSGCIHYGPVEEFYPDNTEGIRESAEMVIRDRSNEPAKRALPPLTTSG